MKVKTEYLSAQETEKKLKGRGFNRDFIAGDNGAGTFCERGIIHLFDDSGIPVGACIVAPTEDTFVFHIIATNGDVMRGELINLNGKIAFRNTMISTFHDLRESTEEEAQKI